MFRADLLIFDLDGTLADTKDDLASSVNLTLKDLGLPLKTPEVIRTYVGGGVRRLIQQAVGEEGERLSEALRIFRKHYLVHLLDKTRLYPGMAEVLEYFRSKKKAVVTNKAKLYTDKILDGLNVTSLFDAIMSGDNGVPLKPDPEMINVVIEELHADRSSTVMIGDGLHDIYASRAAGVAVCAVGYGLGDPVELREARPDFFCDKVDELLTLFN